MLHFVSGNMFDYDVEAYVNPVNCFGKMGAGLAAQFKTRFPENFKFYYSLYRQNKLKPGEVYAFQFSQNPRKFVINFPTKYRWDLPSEYEYIQSGLVALKKFILENKISSIALPALGCGLGGLEWRKVKAIIKLYLSDLDDIDIFIFEPPEEKQISEQLTTLQLELRTLFAEDNPDEQKVLMTDNALLFLLGARLGEFDDKRYEDYCRWCHEKSFQPLF